MATTPAAPAVGTTLSAPRAGVSSPAALAGTGASASNTTSSQGVTIQPAFDKRITTLAFPLSGNGAGTIQRGYMIWDQPIPGYSGKAMVNYLYNPSTVSADYNIADPSVQAAMNFPIASDTSQLAIPLQQTANWTLMFDRTYEVNNGGVITPGGTTSSSTTYGDGSPQVVGVQADVLAMMQFTGMLTNYSYGTAPASVQGTGSTSFSANQGIMQLVPSYFYFGNASLASNVSYYGYITEWSVQYTDWTQYNVPYRCVIAVYITMLPPQQQTTTGTTSTGTGSADAAGSLFGNAVNQLNAQINASSTGKSGR